MLKQDIFVGQKVGYKLVGDDSVHVGTVLGFFEESPDTHVIIELSNGENVCKRFNTILGLLS